MILGILVSLALWFLPDAPSVPLLQDDGFGHCPAFSHYHALGNAVPGRPAYELRKSDGIPVLEVNGDGKCHRDDNDAVIPDPPNPAEDWI